MRDCLRSIAIKSSIFDLHNNPSVCAGSNLSMVVCTFLYFRKKAFVIFLLRQCDAKESFALFLSSTEL